MKINKLFHWLYGALMCLPLLGVLFTSLYVTFNPNAKDSYYGETINESEKVIINNINDLKQGYVYQLETSASTDLSFVLTSNDYRMYIDNVNVVVNPTTYDLSLTKSIGFYRLDTMQNVYIYFFDESNTLITSRSSTSPDTLITFDLVSVDLRLTELISNCDFISEIVYNKFSFLDNAFTYAINDINNNPLYNWAQDSFLVAPIAFVTGLFGLTQTSPVVTLLSYWLTISIVWLVFDLIMYIPLLVHRWLDKGVIS